MKPEQPIRRATVKLTPRQKEDAAEVLEAVREALRLKNIQLRVRSRPTAEQSAPEEGFAGRPDEELESKARCLANDALDRAAAEIREKTTASNLAAEERIAQIAAVRQGNWAMAKFWLARSVQITVKLYETIVQKASNIAEFMLPKELPKK